MIKNAFDFIFKALFDLKIFKFLSRLFDLVRKRLGLISKIWLISKVMATKPGYQAIIMHIFPNILKEVKAIRQ